MLLHGYVGLPFVIAPFVALIPVDLYALQDARSVVTFDWLRLPVSVTDFDVDFVCCLRCFAVYCVYVPRYAHLIF